jgi:hypothetical protein
MTDEDLEVRTRQDIEARTRQLEISMGIVRHDVNNMRMAVTGLDTKIDKLRSSIVGMTVTIIGSLFIIFVGIIGYFMVQKDTQLNEMRQLATRVEIASHK